MPFSVCLAPQLLTSKQCVFISVSVRGSTGCFLETPCTFLFACVPRKGNPTGNRHMNAFINPSLLSSLLQAVLLQLKSPFDCSRFASLAFVQPGVIPQIFYLERKKERCSLREQRKGCSHQGDILPGLQDFSCQVWVLSNWEMQGAEQSLYFYCWHVSLGASNIRLCQRENHIC